MMKTTKNVFLTIAALIMVLFVTTSCETEPLDPVLENNDPTILENIPEQTLFETFVSVEFDLLDAFMDPDDDQLFFIAVSSNPNVVSVDVVGSTLTVNEGGELGNATITITVEDGNGGTLSATVPVEVKFSLNYRVLGVWSDEAETVFITFNEDNTFNYSDIWDLELTGTWEANDEAVEINCTEIDSFDEPYKVEIEDPFDIMRWTLPSDPGILNVWVKK